MQTQNPIPPNSDFDRISNATRDDSGFLGQRLRFKKGRWMVIAAEKNGKDLEVRGKDTFIIDLLSYSNGWFKWAENRPVVRLLFRPVDSWRLPAREHLPDTEREKWPINNGNPEDPWREVHQFVLKDASPPGFGLLTWQASGYFQIKHLKRFLNKMALPEVRKQPSGMMPVVSLGSAEESSSYGDLPVPALTIVGWQPFGDDAAPPGDPDRVAEFRAAVAGITEDSAPRRGTGMVDITPPPKKALPARSTARDDMDDEIPF